MAKYKDELTCDLAETYQIYDFQKLPVKTLATLTIGLRDDSRVKRAINNQHEVSDNTLLSLLIDLFTIYIYKQSKKNSSDFPEPILKKVLPLENFGFDTIEEFELQRIKILQSERG